MTEQRPATSDGAPGTAAYSKDYWDLVGGQLAKRRSVRVAAVVLALFYAAAIYAPFLANDRPLYFHGTDYNAYRGAWRIISNASNDLLGKAQGGQAAFDDWREAQQQQGASLEGSAKQDFQQMWAEAPTTLAQWLEVDRQSLALRVRVMRRQLSPEHHGLLEQLSAAADAVVAAAVDGTGVSATADEAPSDVALGEGVTREATSTIPEPLAEGLRAASAAVKGQLRPARYDSEPEAGKTVALTPTSSYPVIESLTRIEVYFMVLWALVLTLPLWNRALNALLLRGDRERIRGARRRKLAAVLLLPLLAVLGWELVHGTSDSDFQTMSFKQAMTLDKARAERIIATPIAFGMAEQHDAEQFRAPTWVASAAIDEQGFFAGESQVDEDGRTVHRTPVTVRTGEPERNSPWRHPLGSDSLGRDQLARMLWGGRISLSVGLISTALLVLIGTIMGALAGYFGGWVDLVISRIIEIFQCFPVFFLILIVVSFLGPSVINIMLAIGIFRWTGVARLVRGEFIRLRGLDFVVASQALGVRSARTIFRHVLPNALGPVLVAATFAVASGILTESALSFLGFGVKLPIPSWGSLLNESRSAEHWWIQVFPGVAVFITVILYNLVGEGVRDALDPRLKEG
ncbi:MAG: hypothetical protein DRQ55_02335 [Planctomycetota bacterium]|nr:MAG: hypothetical protein DRQ55_02335 [Planctomycetota bacterium]